MLVRSSRMVCPETTTKAPVLFCAIPLLVYQPWKLAWYMNCDKCSACHYVLQAIHSPGLIGDCYRAYPERMPFCVARVRPPFANVGRLSPMAGARPWGGY